MDGRLPYAVPPPDALPVVCYHLGAGGREIEELDTVDEDAISEEEEDSEVGAY